MTITGASTPYEDLKPKQRYAIDHLRCSSEPRDFRRAESGIWVSGERALTLIFKSFSRAEDIWFGTATMTYLCRAGWLELAPRRERVYQLTDEAKAWMAASKGVQ
jgi:hypothetical protein